QQFAFAVCFPGRLAFAEKKKWSRIKSFFRPKPDSSQLTPAWVRRHACRRILHRSGQRRRPQMRRTTAE
ncbi:unnamed protein product, partial [Ectocarpus sp. 12 AP-2014]